MTRAEQNLFFKAGGFLSSCCILLLLMLAENTVPLLPESCNAAAGRPPGILIHLLGQFFVSDPLVPFISLFTAVLYTLFVSCAILILFGKIQTPVLLFFGLFALTFMFEILRILVPLKELYNISPVMLVVGTRILIFSRLFGTFSLLISGVYAAGFDMQKQGKLIIGAIIALLVISLRLPVNGYSWDTSYTPVFAYSLMFRHTEAVLALITGISFLIAAFNKGISGYRFIALGAILVFSGRSLLFGADAWLALLPALILLTAGTWLLITKLQKILLNAE